MSLTATRWLSPAAAADHLDVYVHRLRGMVSKGLIPAPSLHLGPRQPRYDRAAIDQAMRGQRPEDERAVLLAELSTEQWRSIRRARAEASVLDAAEAGKPVLEVVLSHIVRRQSGDAVWDARDERTHGGTALPLHVLDAPLDVRLADIFRHPPPDPRRKPRSG